MMVMMFLVKLKEITIIIVKCLRQNESTENVGEASGEVTGAFVPSPGNAELQKRKDTVELKFREIKNSLS